MSSLAIFPSMSADAATSALQQSSNNITICVDKIIREQEISPVMSYANFQYCNETPSDDDDISTISIQTSVPKAQKYLMNVLLKPSWQLQKDTFQRRILPELRSEEV